ncbi:putative membrane protein [Geobacillus kaustophilus]|uniref:Putative membrane protein n=1 Tax=Geobacillus kaustophilus TaxID=1462 RepID=A0A0D8BVK1_GEOKU|nr:hypothetical protein [Geobacillus kaustophilus]KJE27412.1 putative membrane protein [Geobacillus kaustophilus]
MARWTVFFLTAAAGSFITWMAIVTALGESGDGSLGLTAVVALQNCLIILLLVAVLERLTKK